MKLECIEYEVERGRARITLNRPEKHNALSDQLLEELNQCLWEADNDRAVHVVILRGRGQELLRGLRPGPGGRGRKDPEGKSLPRRS